ncbi:MAG: M3 family oligoendopeptidase [Defluviitaleaceae bacterium]|nr:M3 family oligoendopeptidase [Defluviitaleaceae bacterium]
MNMRWSLDDLYTGFDSEKFKNEFAAFEAAVSGLKEWTAESLKDTDAAKEKIEEYIRRVREVMDYYTLSSYASLVLSVDTMNERARKVSDVLDEIFTELSEPSVRFQAFVGELDCLDELIPQSETLTEHAFMLRTMKERYKYLLSEEEEALLAKLQTTGSNAWEALYGHLTSTLTVDIGGEKVPLAIARDMAHDGSAEVRKNAYDAELAAYDRIDKSLSFAINAIKGEALTTCKLRGYESPLGMSLINSHMDKETLDAMFAALRDSLPAFRKYLRKKSELLGHANGLPFYDLFAPMGEAEIKFSYDEAAEFVIKNFYGFSQRMGDFARHAFENGWIDAEPREGKQGGAFCHSLRAIKQSRMLCNFTGTLNNVLTIAHELGHAYHSFCLKDASPLNASYPMQVAETASNFCEIILTAAAVEHASPEERLVILEQSISDAAQVTVDIYSRFLFESRVFESRKDGGLSVGELKEFMLDAQKEAYGDGLDHEFLHPYMWACKPHYYSADNNFYNFPYAYGMLFARGLYADYLRDKPAFVEKYDKILIATGCNDLRGVGTVAGIDVGKQDFWKSSFEIVERDISEWVG